MTAGELCRVLIVDDEILIRQGIKHYILWEQEGFEVVGEASNGQEALELIETANPHIILTDIVMPIMDGEELTRIVKERYPHIEMIILSSFGEFDYVRSAFQSGVVDYILKPKLEAKGLLSVLKKAASRIPAFQHGSRQNDGTLSVRRVIERVIAGYEVDANDEAVGENFPYSHFRLLGIDLSRYPAKGNPELKARIKETAEASLLQLGSEAIPIFFDSEKDVISVLVHGGKQEAGELPRLAEKVAEAEQQASIAVGEEFTDLTQLRKSFKELIKMLNYRFYLPDRQVFIKEELPPLPAGESSFSLDWFTGELKKKNFGVAFSFLEEHAEVMSKTYTIEVFEYKSFFGNIIFNIAVLLGNLGYPVKELDNRKHVYFNAIEKAQTAGQVNEQLRLFISEANSCILSAENPGENPNLRNVMDYIKKHYSEPLTLTGVAKQFHFNPSYLSSFFSSHNNESFIEFLNRVRIEEASRRLVHDQASISEISSAVGFSDHSYFCKVFKKTKGLSPSQYRRNKPGDKV